MPPKNNIPADATLMAYAQDMSKVYHLTPALLAPTDGSASLFKNYDAYGAYMRKEHFLCDNNLAGTCTLGRWCRHVHLTVDVSTVKSNVLHHNAPVSETDEMVVVAKYPRHVPGKPVEVFDHKSRQSITVDSGMLLVTAGSDEYFVKAEGAPVAPRMQQCTHFQRKQCLRGPECSFLHVLNFKPDKIKTSPTSIEVHHPELTEGGPESPTTSSTGISFNEGHLPPFFFPQVDSEPPPPLPPLPMVRQPTAVAAPTAQGGAPTMPFTQSGQVVYILPPHGAPMPQFMTMPPPNAMMVGGLGFQGFVSPTPQSYGGATAYYVMSPYQQGQAINQAPAK